MKNSRKNARHNVNRAIDKAPTITSVPVITIEEAKKQGMTRSEALTMSRCLERIARKGYRYDDPDVGEAMIDAYDRRAAFSNARSFRLLAKSL